MSSNLPFPVAQYFEGINAFDAAAAASRFAANAVVHDEGRDHVGGDAIRQWAQSTIDRYATQMTVKQATRRGDTAIVVVEMSGRFPGSPATASFAFRVEHDRIAHLEVRP